MKNVNKWFLFNPLFVLYTDSENYLSILKDSNQIMMYFGTRVPNLLNFDPFDPELRQMDSRDNRKIESQLVNHPSANQVRKRFREENEQFSDFFGGIDYEHYPYEKTPIALITFVLSVFLATDFSLRKTFYDLYHGKKIPAITQWCLNTFRTRPISDREWITDFDFIDDEYQTTLYCCGLGNTFADKSVLKQRPNYMVTWFSLWEKHFNSDESNYLEPVKFTRVSSFSPEKNYLCGLTVENGAVTSSETCYFHQLSDHEKRVYTMLARVLDSVCVPENTILPAPHKNLLERDFNEGIMVPQLIQFIVSGCKTFLT